MRFLGSVGAKQVGEAASVRRATSLPTYRYGRPYTPWSVGRDVDAFVRDTHDRVTWVFKAVYAVASNAARLKVVARKDDPVDGEEIDHYMLPLLNFRSSPYTNEQAYVFRHRLSAQLELSSRGVFIEMIRDRSNKVIAMHLMPPGCVQPIPSPATFVSGYEITISDYKVVVPPERILWVKNPHPLDPYRSMTPYEAAGIAVDTDWLAHLYNANFMRNDGRGATLVAAKGGLDDDTADELSAWFQGGPSKAGTTRVLEADGLDIVDLASSPRDMQYVEMRNLSKEEIFIAGGVPESVAGNASGRTFDNADAEKETFWQEKMLGHLELVAGAYDLADGDPNTFIVHDTSQVPALQRSEQQRRQELRDEWDRGLITVDEYRDATGREPFDEPTTQVPWISSGQTPMFSAGPAAQVVPLPSAPPAPAPNGNGAPPAEVVTEAAILRPKA